MKRSILSAILLASVASAAQSLAATNPASGAIIAVAPKSGAHKIIAACSGDAFMMFDGRTGVALTSVPVRCGRAGATLLRGQGIAISGEDADGPSVRVVRLDGSTVSRTAIDAAPVGRVAPSPDGSVVAVISGSGALVLLPPGGGVAPVVVPKAGIAATDPRESWRGQEGAWCNTKQGAVFALSGIAGPRTFDGRGHAQTLYGAALDQASARATCVDLDGDGVDELLWAASGHVSAVASDGTVRWSVAMPSGAAIDAPIIAVATDRGARVIGVNNAGWVSVNDDHGNVVEGFPRRATGGVRGEPLVADVDGDARLDVLVVGADGSLSAFALDDGHTTLDPTPLAASNWVAATPLVADVEGEGKIEILLVDANGTLSRRALPPTALSASMAAPWPGANGSLDGATHPPAIVSPPDARPTVSTISLAPADVPSSTAEPPAVSNTDGGRWTSGCALSNGKNDGTSAIVVALGLAVLGLRRRRRA